MESNLYLAGIEPESIVDGPGLRTVVFLQGCIRKCPGCQNPSTWPREGGTEFSSAEVMGVVEGNPLCHGVTFSGGEPFLQAKALADLARSLHQKGYEVACYTGFLFEELLEGTQAQKQLLENLDILIDGPYVESERSLGLRYRGSRNQRVLDVPRSLRDKKAVLSMDSRWRDIDEPS